MYSIFDDFTYFYDVELTWYHTGPGDIAGMAGAIRSNSTIS